MNPVVLVRARPAARDRAVVYPVERRAALSDFHPSRGRYGERFALTSFCLKGEGALPLARTRHPNTSCRLHTYPPAKREAGPHVRTLGAPCSGPPRTCY